MVGGSVCLHRSSRQAPPPRATARPPPDLCTRPSSASEASRATSRRHLCSRPRCCRRSRAVVRRSGHSISHSGLSGQSAQRPEPLSSPPSSPSARPHLLVPEQPGSRHVLVVHKCGPHGPPGVTVGHSGSAGPNAPAHRQVSAPPAPRGNPREQQGRHRSLGGISGSPDGKEAPAPGGYRARPGSPGELPSPGFQLVPRGPALRPPPAAPVPAPTTQQGGPRTEPLGLRAPPFPPAAAPSPRPPAPRARSQPRTPARVRAARWEAGRPGCLSSAGCRGGATRVRAPRPGPPPGPPRPRAAAQTQRLSLASPLCPRTRSEGSGRREGARGRASEGMRQ